MGTSSSNTASTSNNAATSSSSTAPWAVQQPYLTYGFEQAQKAYRQAIAANANLPTYAAPSAATQVASSGITQMAMGYNPLVNAAQTNLTNTLNGSYLQQGNPYLQQMINQTSQAVLPNVQGSFEAAGRFHSGAQAAASASAVANAASNLAFQQYNSERSLQNQALSQATPMTELGYYGLNKLASVGAAQDAGSQAQLAAIRQQSLNPLSFVTQYMNLVDKNLGSSTNVATTTNTVGNSATENNPSLLSNLGAVMKML